MSSGNSENSLQAEATFTRKGKSYGRITSWNIWMKQNLFIFKIEDLTNCYKHVIVTRCMVLEALFCVITSRLSHDLIFD